MKIYSDYILEAQIDGLKNVKTIRHYTTGAALKSILKNGYIEARESAGDDDWKEYDLFNHNVVSFHDTRTDPEWDTFIEHNTRKLSMDGCTPTLALHMKKLCACIEIDYGKLPQLIQDKTHLLNIYGKKAEDFANLWNAVYKLQKNDNEFVNEHLCVYDIFMKIYNQVKNNNNELYDSVSYIINNRYKFNDIFNDDEAQLGIKEITNVCLKYFSNDELNENVGNSYNKKTRLEEIIQNLPWGLRDKNKKQLDDDYEKLNIKHNYLTRKNITEFNDDDIKKLSEYAMKFDVISVVKLLHKHGWRFGDSEYGDFMCTLRMPINGEKKKYGDGSLGVWLDKLAKDKNRIVNADIEIRIPTNVELNKDNCKIIIFDGICEATKQEYLTRLPKKYYDMYNIEHIKPNE